MADYSKIAAEYIKDYSNDKQINKIDISLLPTRAEVDEFINMLEALVFPCERCSCSVPEIIETISKTLVKMLSKINVKKSEQIADEYLKRLLPLRTIINGDIDAFYAGDPACTSPLEVVLSYPGFYAILVYRLAHELALLNIPLLPRMMSESAHRKTGVDINPNCKIGKNFFIDHGTGVVIGETTIIGDNVKIYQGVTLGALSTRGGQSLRGKKRHPTIGNNVTIYSGATVLGGDTIIGDGSVIGGNAFIISSIGEMSKIKAKESDGI